MHTHTKENWIDAALNSLDGIERATPPADLYARILERQNTPRQNALRVRMTPPQRWMVAASIALLLFVNVLTCLKMQQQFAGRANPAGVFATEYFGFLKPVDI